MNPIIALRIIVTGLICIIPNISEEIIIALFSENFSLNLRYNTFLKINSSNIGAQIIYHSILWC
jgi:hypothetical protein